jgi:hypothetical protein
MERQALRSLYMHRSVARRIVDDPTLISKVLSRLEKLAIANPHGRRYHDQWREFLAGPVENLLRIMTEDSLEARDLRKESPLSCLVTSEERIAAYRWVS